MKIMAFILGILFLAAPVQAFEKHFSKYCKNAAVPKELAKAVARQESGLNPLCINIEGNDFHPKSHAEAAEIIKKAESAKKSYDVGLMQINSQWVRQWKIDPVSLLDPETNIRLGVKLLKDEISRHGLGWQAVGRYHSPNPLRGRQYAWLVGRHLKGNDELKSKIAVPGLGSAELRAMLANPRISKALFRSMASNPRLGGGNGKRSRHIRKLHNFKPLGSIHAGILDDPTRPALRKPVGIGSQASR